MDLRLKEKVEGEIIALDDAKNYVHANGNFDDELIKTLIKSGREIIEKILHQSILRERWICKYFRTEFLNKKSTMYPSIYDSTVTIPFPKNPVLEINNVYADDRIVNCKKYHIEKTGPRYYLVIRNLKNLDQINSFTIDFDAGVAKDFKSVPSIFRIANLMIVAQHYEKRNSDQNFVPKIAKTMLSNYIQFGGF
ncbi:MAG: phage gp6-like head-tail connector protein [Alphaproteobacteria bacterium]|nr:phage gp6-like head-tail connector protein [Alphaproteobacteria bacterium]